MSDNKTPDFFLMAGDKKIPLTPQQAMFLACVNMMAEIFGVIPPQATKTDHDFTPHE